MAQIDFFATEPERLAVVQKLFERGCKIIPDLHYTGPTLDEIVRPEDLSRYVGRASQFFIVNDDLMESPLELRKVEESSRCFYYVFPRAGGPILLLFWGKEYIQEGKQHITATTISHYPWYESTRTHERLAPGKEILAIYSQAARVVRTFGRKIRPGVRPYWITPRVEDLVRNGALLVGLESFSAAQILA